jgi:hypothetical protein
MLKQFDGRRQVAVAVLAHSLWATFVAAMLYRPWITEEFFILLAMTSLATTVYVGYLLVNLPQVRHAWWAWGLGTATHALLATGNALTCTANFAPYVAVLAPSAAQMGLLCAYESFRARQDDVPRSYPNWLLIGRKTLLVLTCFFFAFCGCWGGLLRFTNPVVIYNTDPDAQVWLDGKEVEFLDGSHMFFPFKERYMVVVRQPVGVERRIFYAIDAGLDSGGVRVEKKGVTFEGRTAPAPP